MFMKYNQTKMFSFKLHITMYETTISTLKAYRYKLCSRTK